jgi:hypothetical protein
MIRVTFKHEGEEGGQIIGPVLVIDQEKYDNDPEVRAARERGSFGIPFGHKPEGMTELGWMTLAQARREAKKRGVELEEV